MSRRITVYRRDGSTHGVTLDSDGPMTHFVSDIRKGRWPFSEKTQWITFYEASGSPDAPCATYRLDDIVAVVDEPTSPAESSKAKPGVNSG